MLHFITVMIYLDLSIFYTLCSLNLVSIEPERANHRQLLERKDYDGIEKEFWNCVENNNGDHIQVEYAADLPANEFGVNPETSEIHKQYSDHKWNLNKMYQRNNSLLQF